MRPVQVALTATGNTGIIPLDWKQAPFNVGLTINISGTATASMLSTMDDPTTQITPTSIVQSASTTVTVTTPTKHGLTTNDWVQIANSGSAILDGLYAVATVGSDTTFTYLATSGTNTAGVFVYYIPFRMFAVASMNAISASAASNLAFPVRAVLGICSAYTSGEVIFNIIQGIR